MSDWNSNLQATIAQPPREPGDLSAAGVKRISLTTSLYRAAMTGLLNAAKEVREHGTFGYIDTSLATPEMNAFLRE